MMGWMVLIIFAIVFYVCAIGMLVEAAPEYYSFQTREGRRRVLLHGIPAIPVEVVIGKIFVYLANW
jgi:hypothetical protein